jgi:UDP-glucose 4-epimerase
VPTQGLTVAVTGPTGDLGISVVDALEGSRSVKRVIGMARRPFDPKDQGWKKTEYREGDVQDAASVRELVKGADVVVHLAFAILSAGEATRELNVEGSRRVFEEAGKAGVERLCYASSVAAYGFHDDNPDWLTEEVPPRGTPEHFYSQQKAEVEGVLGNVLLRYPRTVAYAFRPCIVAGPTAQTMLQEIPYVRLSEAMPDAVRNLVSSMPILRPVIPDPGTRFQLVHEDDVASAFLAGVQGKGDPGIHRRGGRSPTAAGGHVVDPQRAEARAHEDRPCRERAEVEAQVHDEGHPEGHGGRPPLVSAGGPLATARGHPTSSGPSGSSESSTPNILPCGSRVRSTWTCLTSVYSSRP